MAQKKKKTKEKKSSNKLVPVIETQQLPEIEFNFEEAKDKLEDKLEEYENFEVTEDNLQDAKKERANLNKVKKFIKRARIDTKKEVMKPVDVFEDKMKTLYGIVEDVVDGIDEDIKKFDEKRKQEKKELAENIVAEKKELSDLPKEYLERIEFKDSFSNLSTSQKAIEDDVDEQIEVLEKEYGVQKENEKVIENKIEKVNEDIEGKLYPDDYIEKLGEETSLSDVLGMIDDRVEKIKEEESEEEDDEPEEESSVEKKQTEKEKEESKDKDEEEITVELKVTATESKLKRLKEYMVDNKINHELKK